MEPNEEERWFAEWRESYIGRSGSSGRFSRVHPDFWREVRDVLRRHRISGDEWEHVTQHLIRHGPQWPDQLIPAIERAVAAIRPSVLAPPPLVARSAAAQRERVMDRLRDELGDVDSSTLESKCYHVMRLAAERLVRDARMRSRSIDAYSDESIHQFLEDAIDAYLGEHE